MIVKPFNIIKLPEYSVGMYNSVYGCGFGSGAGHSDDYGYGNGYGYSAYYGNGYVFGCGDGYREYPRALL
jgi:hypothetical protein